MARGERPIKLGDSWFSAKTIEVVRRMIAVGGRALNGLGGSDPYQTQSNSECLRQISGSQAAGDKFRSREGKSPDRQLRSLNYVQSLRKLNFCDSQDVGLEAATI